MSQPQRFNCDICGQESLTEPDLRTHLLLEHEENAGSCPLCDIRHLTLEELNLHINTTHSTVLSPERRSAEDLGDLASDPIDSKPVTNGLGTAVDFESEVRHCTPDLNKEQRLRELKSESSFTNAVENGQAAFGRNEEISPADPKITNTSPVLSSRGNNKKSTSRSCACSFGVSKNLDPTNPDGSEFQHTNEQTPTNGCSNRASSNLSDTSELSDNSENGCGSSTGGSPSKRNASSILERKRTRSKAQLGSASSSTSSSAVDVNCTAGNSARRSSSSSSSTASPLKKFVRLLSPGSSKKSEEEEMDAKDADDEGDAASRSFRRESDRIWGQDVDGSSMSDPECPFCDISDLDPESMARHVELEHSDVLVSPGLPRQQAQSQHQWNASMIQKPKNSASPKPTLLSLSKQARNLDTVITCPICGLGSYDPDLLTVHINTEHATPGDKDREMTPHKQGTLQDQAGPSTSTDSDPEQAACPVCGISGLDAASMNNHVEAHFGVKGPDLFSRDRQLAQQLAEQERQLQERRQRETFKQLQAKYGMDETRSHKQQSEQDLETAVVRGQITVADYNQQRNSLRRSSAIGVDDGKSRTSGLIQKMVAYYIDQPTQGLSYARLCSETDHFSSTYGDRGWGCGYRNLQMLLSSLVRIAEYRQVLFSGRNAIPSISKLQQLIEAAWAKGFDSQGRDQLGGRVLDSRKWIGATEITAMLSSLRAKCRLIDFHAPSGPRGTHPALFEWVRDYFGRPEATSLRQRVLGSSSTKGESKQTNKMPLYLQHEGHSRTIVGCEVHKDGSIRLLLFDPSYKVYDKQGLGLDKLDGYAMRPIRKSLTQMKAKQYQIVSVERLMTTEQEYEHSKVLRSERKS